MRRSAAIIALIGLPIVAVALYLPLGSPRLGDFPLAERTRAPDGAQPLRLKQNGDDVEGWLRLVRAYMVMGDRDKAKSALTDARQAVANDAERLRQLNEGLKNLGLDG